MTDNVNGPVDLDTLTDEEIMNLDPETIDWELPEENAEVNNEEPATELEATPADPEQGPDPVEPATEVPEGEQEPAADPSVAAQELNAPAGEVPATPEGSQETGNGETEPKAEETPKEPVADPNAAKPGDVPAEPKVDPAQAAVAQAFYEQVTAPFKADGRDFQVQSVEEAIKLMQQGVNYSRRMQELKPLRQMQRMLNENDLTQEKLNHLIDLDKGDIGAVTKLLKEKGIDPLDLDVSKETGYQANNYAGDPKFHAFQDTIQEWMSTPEGKGLISDINSGWDEVSKNKLHEDPSLTASLTEQMNSGIYAKVKTELDRQRTLGYLQNVDYITAYNQVGNAMQKAGVFDTPQPQTPAAPAVAPLTSGQQQPIAAGPRKAAQPKPVQPNPNLSATPPRKAVPAAVATENDFGNLSDEEFAKLPLPV